MTSELKCYCNSVVLQHAESLFDPREEIAAILVFDDKTVPFCIRCSSESKRMLLDSLRALSLAP